MERERERESRKFVLAVQLDDDDKYFLDIWINIYIYTYIFIYQESIYHHRQHIPRSLLSGRLTFRHSQAIDSAIGEHLLTINSCRTSYEDDCFSVLHWARVKFHLKFLEAIYISMNRPSLCRQLNNHTLNIFGELLDTGVTFFFFVLFCFFPFYLTILII